MSDLQKIYDDIYNSNIIKFEQFFYIRFFLKLQDNQLFIYNEKQKNSDEICIKCRKLSCDNWQHIKEKDDAIDRTYTLLLLSLQDSNICELQKNNHIVSLQSFKKFMTLNPNIIRYIVDKINENYQQTKQQNYRYGLLKDFHRLYDSDKGVILQHKQISDYLMLTSFWEKLGLNYFDIKQLPFQLYKQLQLIMSVEMQVKNQHLKKTYSNNSSNNKRPNRMRGRG